MQEVSGSIPLTSTNRLISMHKLGVITTVAGLVLCVLGLVVGFWKMVTGAEAAEAWLGLVPLGFVGLLLGIALTQLSGKR